MDMAQISWHDEEKQSGVWHSPVVRSVRGGKVAGSNPVTPTKPDPLLGEGLLSGLF